MSQKLSNCLSSEFVGLSHDPALADTEVYFDARPGLKTLDNAIFMPAVSHISQDIHDKGKALKYAGGLYTAHGVFVPESGLFRNVGPIASGRTTVPADAAIYQDRDEDVLYLGYLFRHFGHFLIESLARAWAIEELSWSGRVVFHCSPTINDIKPYQYDLLERMGIARHQVELPKVPMRFARVHVPAAALAIQTYIYAIQLRPFETLGWQARAGLRAEVDKIYVSRAGIPTTRAAGELELEDILTGEGFQVVRPEEHSIGEQIGIFNSAGVYVGCVGSAMHNLLYSTQNPEAIFLCRDRPINRNFLMIDAAKQLKSTYLRANLSDPDEVFRSGPWLIDLDRVLGYLRERGLVSSVQVPAASRDAAAREYDAVWYNLRIERHLKDKENQDALEVADKALQLYPESVSLKLLHGRCLLATGASALALPTFEAVIAAAPDEAAAHAGRARALWTLERPHDACEAFAAACDLDEEDADLYADFGTLLMEMVRYPEAIGALETAANLSPGKPRFRAMLSRAQFAAGDQSAALSSIDNAIGLKPDNMAFYKSKVRILKSMGRERDAHDVSQHLSALKHLTK